MFTESTHIVAPIRVINKYVVEFMDFVVVAYSLGIQTTLQFYYFYLFSMAAHYMYHVRVSTRMLSAVLQLLSSTHTHTHTVYIDNLINETRRGRGACVSAIYYMRVIAILKLKIFTSLPHPTPLVPS